MFNIFKKRRIPDSVYRNISMYAEESVVLVNDEHKVIFINNSAQRIFGYSEDEILGQPISMIIPNKEHYDNDSMLYDFARSHVRARYEIHRKFPIYGQHKDGREFMISLAVVNATSERYNCYSLIINDISENKRNEEELIKLAATDPLTGIFNRREFRVVAEKEIMRSRRYGRPLSILMMDIDHFKIINDSFGHAAGDKALQHLTKLCLTSLRTMDVIARWGGEEFVVMLPETGYKGAMIIAERLRKIIETVEFTHNNNKIDITVSIGVSSFKQGDDSVDILLSRSDEAMYKAKQAGRNRVASIE